MFEEITRCVYLTYDEKPIEREALSRPGDPAGGLVPTTLCTQGSDLFAFPLRTTAQEKTSHNRLAITKWQLVIYLASLTLVT